jgi:hypothetical protein
VNTHLHYEHQELKKNYKECGDLLDKLVATSHKLRDKGDAMKTSIPYVSISAGCEWEEAKKEWWEVIESIATF